MRPGASDQDDAGESGLFVARQPICDRDGAIAGYELLYRSSLTNQASIRDPDLATARVLTTTFLEVGLDQLVGDAPAYINLTRPFFTGQIALPVTPDRVVLEVLEDFALDEAVLSGIREFVAGGYRVVLDDFRYRRDYEPALSLVGGVKLDGMALDAKDFRDQLALAKRKGLTVIVERVETEAQFREFRDLGCDLFQGFFFCQPEVITGTPMPTNRAVLLRLIARLEDPDTAIEELERLIVQDVTLSYRLLRQVNSAAFGLPREVASVRQAILLLGARMIRHWASLILLSHMHHDENGFEPLMSLALVRARMCEQLARDEPGCEPTQAFTVGLFSVLDAVLKRPMGELLETVSFSSPVHRALARREGSLGGLLQRVTDYEGAHWQALEAAGADVARHRRAYLEAVCWSDDTGAML